MTLEARNLILEFLDLLLLLRNDRHEHRHQRRALTIGDRWQLWSCRRHIEVGSSQIPPVKDFFEALAIGISRPVLFPLHSRRVHTANRSDRGTTISLPGLIELLRHHQSGLPPSRRCCRRGGRHRWAFAKASAWQAVSSRPTPSCEARWCRRRRPQDPRCGRVACRLARVSDVAQGVGR